MIVLDISGYINAGINAFAAVVGFCGAAVMVYLVFVILYAIFKGFFEVFSMLINGDKK